MAKEKPTTKVCKHCKTEIPYDAKVCPQCRKKQGGGFFKKLLIALGIIIILVIIFGGEDDEKSASDSNPQSVGTVEQQDNSDIDQEVVDNRFSVGEIVETSYLKIKYLSAEEYISDNEYIQPKDGYTYYKMDFEFENISDSDEYVSSFDFICYADDYDMEQVYLDEMDLDATLSPGKKTKGSVFFEVPVDSETITIEYEINFWSEDKVIFEVK